MEPALRELTADEWPGYFRGMASLWGGGLAEEPFVAYQRRLARSPEASGRYRLLGWLDDGGRGPLLSAFKAYDLAGGTGGAKGPALRVLGVGAVFTPVELRRRGHASAMLQQALRSHQDSGFDAALLFSDVGAPFYEKLGFRLVESRECLVPAAHLPRQGGSRPAAPRDEDAITALLAGSRVASGFQLARDGWVVRFQLRRLRELARARAVGEPEWGLVVDERPDAAAALLRLSRDAVDVLDAAWTSDAARDALLGGLRESCARARRDLLRLWPAHQLRGLCADAARPSALGLVAPLHAAARVPDVGGRAELALLDHI
jgi:GNAT superfamily N-acetyltransferase